MKRFLLFLFFTLFTLSPALSLADDQTLMPGDILLQSQPCYVCALIEIEEGLPYSHVGILVQDQQKNWRVLEAWGSTQVVTLEDFLQRRKRGTLTLVRRPHWKKQRAPSVLNRLLWDEFIAKFLGKSYDSAFLWENRDQNGEKFYCSELVAKLLNPLMARPVPTKPMSYEKNRSEWIRYFNAAAHRSPPDGLPGISPADLARSESFWTVSRP